MPVPSTLNPQPSTLNPPPSTLNPQPSTLNPKNRYKPWFVTLFNQDNIVVRYRDINADLKFLKEHKQVRASPPCMAVD